MANDKTIDGYIAGLPDWRGDVVSCLRGIIDAADPGLKSSIKWAQPVWESNGPVCFIKAFPKAVNFGFWRGSMLDAPGLVGDGEKMRHFKLTSVESIDAATVTRLVRQAVQLNVVHGDPTKGK